mmetsp:Transcript_13476/g.38271  ORF Transcript_13476/g.38271 Transcript_13476/m.38271 type:complete len:270 (-) Transcript_13476:686-1495(-)
MESRDLSSECEAPPHSMREAAAARGHRGATQGMITILFCGHEFPSAAAATKEVLKDQPGIEVIEVERSAVAEHIQQATVVVPKMCNIDRSMITSAKRLQLINQFGVGLEGVDIDACDEFGVHVTNIPSDGTGNAASVAEHGIYLMIGILRHHHQMQESIKAKVLGAPMGRTLQGCTVLLVGFGGIAQELAPRLKVFGVKLLAVRKGPWGLQPEVEAAVDVKGGLEDMLELAGQADIVVMLCNQTKETVGMVNCAELSLCNSLSLACLCP